MRPRTIEVKSDAFEFAKARELIEIRGTDTLTLQDRRIINMLYAKEPLKYSPTAWYLGNVETEGVNADAADNIGFARQLRAIWQEDTAGEVSGGDGPDHAVGAIGVID
jgi:hypothetical protein